MHDFTSDLSYEDVTCKRLIIAQGQTNGNGDLFPG